MSLLSVVTDAIERIGLQAPAALIGTSNDDTATQCVALANQQGKALARRAPWQALTKEQIFTSAATEMQVSAVPTDLDRFVPETFWNRTRKRPVIGPYTGIEWQERQARLANVGYDGFRQRGGDIIMSPIPVAGDIFAYEYITKQWVVGGKERLTLDNDLMLLDEELMTLGVIWRFLSAKGFDYAEAMRNYEFEVAQAITKDGSKRVLSMSAGSRGWNQLHTAPGDFSVTGY